MVSTRAAWLGKEEVVEVRFDPKVTSYQELLAAYHCLEKPATVFAHDEAQLAAAQKLVGAQARPRSTVAKDARLAKLSDRKYYLRKSPLWYLPLTPLQELRCNAALATKRDPRAFLSPRQQALLGKIEALNKDGKARLAKLQPARRVADWERYLVELRKLL